MSFIIWNLSKPDDYDDWLRCCSSWPSCEVFAHPGYLSLFHNSMTECVCFFFKCPHGSVIYPFLMRNLSMEHFWDPNLLVAYDISSAYGYAGPWMLEVSNPKMLADEFWSEFDEWAREQNIICEFLRFPLFDRDMLPYTGNKIEKLTNVVRDLEPSGETIWMDYDHKVRKNVNKATRSGLKVEVDLKGDRISDFIEIYHSTMDRRSASSSYYFPADFFETLNTKLRGNFAYFHVLLDKKIISSELILISQQNIYSFLGGTDPNYFELRPNDLLKHTVILWGKEQSKRRFVLGGGYREGDGIFKYKLAFAPRGKVPYYVGTRIILPDLYQMILETRRTTERLTDPSWTEKSDYFPAYRS